MDSDPEEADDYDSSDNDEDMKNALPPSCSLAPPDNDEDNDEEPSNKIAKQTKKLPDTTSKNPQKSNNQVKKITKKININKNPSTLLAQKKTKINETKKK